MLKKWVEKWLSGSGVSVPSAGPVEGTLPGLNLKEVLDAHAAWKERLEGALEGGSPEELEVARVASDRECELGRWLHGEGKARYSRLREYDAAVKAHAEFHLAAAEVVIEHRSGNDEKARRLLATRFREASNSNQLELVRLFVAARE